MNEMKKIQDLVILCNHYSNSYYNLDKPEISDKEYDKLYDELLSLENQTNYILSSSPTQKVQGEVLPFLKKVNHTEPMLSAEKSKNINDIVKFIGNQNCVISWKLDGLTIVLRYNNGKLQQAITRGGGLEGEDVTHSVKTFTNIPLSIDYKGYLEIRGEGLIAFEDFKIINSDLVAKGEETYSSPRNLASGSVRQLDSNITKQRNLKFIAFGIVKCDLSHEYKVAQLLFLEQMGFEIVMHTLITKEELKSSVEFFKGELLDLPYLTDGLIIEYNNIAYGKSQGVTGHHSKNMYALKWEDDSYKTTFRGVELNTTRTGMVSLTALFNEVTIDGVNVSKASLHNYDIFKSLELGVGDIVSVYRANQVIPQIEENLTRSNTYKINMVCPSCGNKIEIIAPKEAKFLFCKNLNCPAQLVKKFSHFVSRDAMNIDGLSEATLQKFIDKGFITTFPDIYKLDRYKSEIINMQGFGKRSYDKLIDSIEKSKNVKLENFIFALGISNVGKGSSKIIAKAFGNDWFRFEDGLCNEFNFTSLEDFGEVIHKSIHSWFDNPHERKFWTELTYILNFIKEENKNVEIVDNPLKGMKVYATGSFKNFKKDEIKKVLEDLGCEFASGYSKSLDALIEGSLKSSSKVDKAKKDGIRVITEDEFMEMIGQS